MLRVWKTKVLDHFGLEIQRQATLANFLRTREIDLIVDVGANLGQFAQSVRSKGFRGRIHSFEPVSYVFEALKRSADRDELWQVTRTALGSAPGMADINVLGNHTLSSFLTPTDLSSSYNNDTLTRTERVEVQTLNHALADDQARAIFLKIDVQGFEQQVLEGASEILARSVGLYLELPIQHLYEGTWSFRDAINYMDDLGFEPAQFRMVAPLPDDPACAIEFDALFKRKG